MLVEQERLGAAAGWQNASAPAGCNLSGATDTLCRPTGLPSTLPSDPPCVLPAAATERVPSAAAPGGAIARRAYWGFLAVPSAGTGRTQPPLGRSFFEDGEMQ